MRIYLINTTPLLLILLVTECLAVYCYAEQVTNQDEGRNRNREIAMNFVNFSPEFVTNKGKELTLIAEEPLRFRHSWVFDLSYIGQFGDRKIKKYISVVVKKGKPSFVKVEKEQIP